MNIKQQMIMSAVLALGDLSMPPMRYFIHSESESKWKCRNDNPYIDACFDGLTAEVGETEYNACPYEESREPTRS